MPMTSLHSLAFILGASFASGLNLYATVATLGLLHRNGVVQLPHSIEILANPWVVGIALTLYVVELVADKSPYVESGWDAIDSLIRPPAAALLAYRPLGSVSDEWRVPAALRAGSGGL